MAEMIPPEIRLRRAIHLRSLSLLQRIYQANSQHIPDLIRNADLDEKGETSLHLAAKLGLPAVAKWLLANGHEDNGISRMFDDTTPLMVAAAAGGDDSNAVTAGRVAVARLLIERNPEASAIKNKEGNDAFLIACRHGTVPLITLLLSLPPPASLMADPDIPPPPKSPHLFLNSRDNSYNTPLHHASAFGQLKTLRLLIAAGADPTARNMYHWTAFDYSATVSAEVYFRELIKEREQRQALEMGIARGNVNITRARGGSDTQRIANPGVRLVRSEGSVTSEESEESTARVRTRAGTFDEIMNLK